MAFAKVHSAQTSLLNAHIVDIEVDITNGLYAFSVVGLPDKAVEEARDRISAAIKNSGFKSPKSKNQKVVISLAPADLKKEGPMYDLGMALSYLLAAEEINFNTKDKLFLGELALDGSVRAVQGVLPLVRKAKALGFKSVFVPKDNAAEAALIDAIFIFPVRSLSELIEHLDESGQGEKIDAQEKTEIPEGDFIKTEIGFEDVRGQETAKRGLEIAAAGGHNVAMYGPPGTGKSMLARAFAGILPPLTFDEMLEVTGIHSVTGTLKGHLISNPPFRSPHHTSSYVALVGGGTNPHPGEATLAHKGVLFLDEFPEFDRRVIEALRQPLEDRVISVSRAKGSAEFPANFILVAAMNPCPCGNYGFKGKACECIPSNLMRYQRKLSGPILERIDIWLGVPRIEHEKLSDDDYVGESTDAIRERVKRAREIQRERLGTLPKAETNAEMSVKDLVKVIHLSDDVKSILNSSAESLGFSPRVYHKVIKIARTIADLAESEHVLSNHIMEAINYRPKKQ